MGFRALTEERESAFLSLELTRKDEKICVDMAYKGMWVGLGQWFQRKVWPDGLDLTVIPKARSLAIKCWW